MDDEGPMLFDMEFAGPGPRVYDVATFNWSIVLSKRQVTNPWTNFLIGYTSVRPVPDLELVPVLAAARCMWLLGQWAGAETLEPNSTWQPQRNISPIVDVCRRFVDAARATPDLA